MMKVKYLKGYVSTYYVKEASRNTHVAAASQYSSFIAGAMTVRKMGIFRFDLKRVTPT